MSNSTTQDAMSESMTDAQRLARAGISAPPASAALGNAARDIKRFRSQGNCNIICDSCADFSPAVAEALGIEVIPFSYVLDGEEHLDDMWAHMSPHDFYERMREGASVSTSAVTPGRYYEVFSAAAQKGVPTLYLAFTRGLSSSVEAAQTAAQMVRDEHPDFELYVLDNLLPSACAELLAI